MHAIACAAALLLGCDSDDDDHDDGGEIVEVSVDECHSGRKWIGGNEESRLMRPGGDCIGCHTAEDEGPRYLVAGTVYELPDEPDDCLGVEGVTVEITDADGAMWSLTTNEAGNFYISPGDGPIAMPYQAQIVLGQTVLPMATHQSEGSCASCHTQAGENQAIGRIYLSQ